MYTVASPDHNPREGGQLPNPNQCNSTLTSGTKNIYPYPYINVNDRGHRFRSGSPLTNYPHARAVRGAPPPPPTIFELLKLPQQIIYRRKRNLFESPYMGKIFWFLHFISNFREDKAIMYFAKFLNAFVKPRNLNFSRNKLYVWNLQITRFKMIYDIFVF